MWYYIHVVIPFATKDKDGRPVVWRYPFQDIGSGWDDLEAATAYWKELCAQHPTLEFDIRDHDGTVVVEK